MSLIIDEKTGKIIDVVDTSIDQLKREPYKHNIVENLETFDVDTNEEDISQIVRESKFKTDTEENEKYFEELNGENDFVEAGVAFIDFLSVFNKLSNAYMFEIEINKIKNFLRVDVS